MIEAVRWRPFLRWFGRHATGRIRSTFGAVHVHGLDRLRHHAEEAPLLVIANHTAWWDALIALWLSETELAGVAAFGMMDAENLRRLRFFRWLGAFGVDRTSRRDGALATRYAVELLRRRGHALWLFPQGQERPAHVPLRFEPGAAGIAKRARFARVIPVAFAYVFEGDEKPQVYVSIGEAMSFEDGADRAAQERAVDGERQRIARQLETRSEVFVAVFQRNLGPVSRWATAALDRFAGWLAPRQARSRRALPEPPARVEPERATAPLHLGSPEHPDERE